MRRGQTPAQTLGPFFHVGLVRAQSPLYVSALPAFAPDIAGHRLALEEGGLPVRIEGGVYDGRSDPVSDALVEIWQADARGRYASERVCAGEVPAGSAAACWGLGRSATDARGEFFFETIKPGQVADTSGAASAPHVNVIVGARGMSRQLFTRLYFGGDAGLERDPVLARVPPERRHTLLARCLGDRAGSVVYRFDIRLQGEDETVFFDF